MTTLTLIGKPGCHLCDVAGEVIDAVVAELPDAAAERIEIVERSIADDPALHALWWEKIPVVLIDDELHAHWRVSPDRLRTALEGALKCDALSDRSDLSDRSCLSDRGESKCDALSDRRETK